MPVNVLVAAPGDAPDEAAAAAWMAAAQGAGLAAERLRPCSEAALRTRLQAGGADLLVLVASLRSRAAAHATLALDSSAGPGARTVNLRHLAGLLGQAPGLRAVLLQAAPGSEAGDTDWAAALAAGGLPAALHWPSAAGVPLFASAAARWMAAWRDGAGWARLASAEAAGVAPVGAAGDLPGTAAAVPVAPAVVAAAPMPVADPEAARAAAVAAGLAAKRTAGRFDVFLCHHSVDKPAVRALARALQARGVLPWLDEWELPPGQPWQPLLQQQIAAVGSAAVCVGGAGIGPWQALEMDGLLQTFVDRRVPVIPVLLPDAPAAPALPLFLRGMTYVDFRQPVPDPLARLVWGITGVRPDAG